MSLEKGKKMKIAYIFDQVLPCVAADVEQVVNTVSAMSKLPDVDVTLIIPADNQKTNTDVEEIRQFYHVDGPFKVELYHSVFPSNRIVEKLAHPLMCARYSRVLRQFDVIYCRNIPAVWVALALRIPVVLDTYRPYPDQHPALNPMFRLFFKDPCFLGMTYHSDYARQHFLKLGVEEAKTCVAHNGYSKAQFEPVLTKDEAREKLGLPKDVKIAVYTGRMVMRKGLNHLVMLAKARPDVHFVFVGSTEKGEFETAVEAMHNCHVVGWKGFGEVAPYLYAADVVIIPPTLAPLKKIGNTVLPIKLYSYIASGRAIYAPDAPDTAEILKHDINAWLVTPDDEADELAGFNALIDNDELIDRLSAAAAEDAKKLTWDARAACVVEFMKARLKVYAHSK
ncbi:MAG: glycosyltransferase family 4 protein [Proteobacteria bacterium]|jgi:glycosyltransferase involved in cell wall biosynthesis|nr:glycosyltransferase family 4 protein [Pseudomonadota bacterium]